MLSHSQWLTTLKMINGDIHLFVQLSCRLFVVVVVVVNTHCIVNSPTTSLVCVCDIIVIKSIINWTHNHYDDEIIIVLLFLSLTLLDNNNTVTHLLVIV